MKILKNVFLSFTIMTILFISSDKVKALEFMSKEVFEYTIEQTAPEDLDLSFKNGTIYSDKYLKEMKKNNERLQTSNVENHTCKVTRGGICWDWRTLKVTYFPQKNGFYCGPANIKQVINYINGWSESQDTYGIRMGTNPQIGTYVYKMRNELNYRQSYHRYSYTQMNPEMSNMFKKMIRNNIFYGDDTEVKGKPVILHAKTGSLFKYNKVDIGHYLTVNGYNRFNHNIDYVDTWNADYGHGYTGGQNTDNFNAVFNTVSNYRYVIS